MAFDPFTAVFDLVKTGLEKFIPDANTRAEVAASIAGQVHTQVMGQIEVNKIEAASANIFVSGWRPAIGWICGGAYLYTFLIYPFIALVLSAVGHPIVVTDIPKLDMGELSLVLGGMLGLGAMRSWDKSQGTSK